MQHSKQQHTYTGVLTMPKCLPKRLQNELIRTLQYDERLSKDNLDPAFRIEQKDDKVFVTVPSLPDPYDPSEGECAVGRIAVAWQHTLSEIIAQNCRYRGFVLIPKHGGSHE